MTKLLPVAVQFPYRSFTRLLVPLALAVIILTGCDKELSELNERQVTKKLSPAEEQLIQSTNRLAFTMLNAEAPYEKNTIFSPVSLGMALGMLGNTLDDGQRQKIEEMSGLAITDINELNKTFNGLLSFFQVYSDQLHIHYANSMWFAFGNDINEEFRSKVMAYYDAEVSELNFKGHGADDHVGKWIEHRTEGLFHDVSPKIPAKDWEVMLINAFGLDADWAQPALTFRANGTFLSGKGKSKNISMLNMDGVNVRWADDGNMTMVDIPMRGDMFSLTVVLPENDLAINEFLSSFSAADFNMLIDNAVDAKANISMPELSFSGDLSFRNALSGVGLSSLFNTRAGLHNSFLNPQVQLADIYQVARIALGSEQLIPEKDDIVFSSPGLMTIAVNRPFVYFIRDRHSHTILFAGLFADPS